MSPVAAERMVTSGKPSQTRYLMLDTSPMLRQARLARKAQVARIRRNQTQRYNDTLRRAIAAALAVQKEK